MHAYAHVHTRTHARMHACMHTYNHLPNKVAIMHWVRKEGLNTSTEYESAIFSKLSLAYVFNSCVTPLAVGAFFSYRTSGRAVTQSWYETGGVTNQAVFLILSNAIFTGK